MKEFLATLEELKRATESYAKSIHHYADSIDPQAPSEKDKEAMRSTADEAEEWLNQA